MEFRNTPPRQGRLKFKLGNRPQIEKLANGMDLYLINVNSTELVRVDFMFKGGQWVQDKPLQTAMSMKMLREGIIDSSLYKIPHYIDYKGVSIDVTSNMSYCVLSLSCLKRYVCEIIPIIVSVLNNLPFEGDKFRIALEQSKRSFEISMDTVGEQCKRLFYKSLYGVNHPMSRFPEYVDYDSLTIHDLKSYCEKYITAPNCNVFLTGNLTSGFVSDFIKTIQKYCLRNGGNFNNYPLYELSEHDKRYVLKMEKPLVQSSIRIGREFLSRTHADYIPMTVLSTVLGGYFGSRLMSVIREEKGYTYDIHSVIYQMPLNSSFVITTETGNKYVENVIEDIYVEMDKLSSELIPNEELQQVKNYMLGNMCRNYEFGFGFSNRIMQLICSGIKLDDIITGAEIISDLTSNKLRDISSKYLSPNSMIECVVTNA